MRFFSLVLLLIVGLSCRCKAPYFPKHWPPVFNALDIRQKMALKQLLSSLSIADQEKLLLKASSYSKSELAAMADKELNKQHKNASSTDKLPASEEYALTAFVKPWSKCLSVLDEDEQEKFLETLLFFSDKNNALLLRIFQEMPEKNRDALLPILLDPNAFTQEEQVELLDTILHLNRDNPKLLSKLYAHPESLTLIDLLAIMESTTAQQQKLLQRLQEELN